MRVLILVDGLHARSLVDSLAGVVELDGNEALVLLVHGIGPRAGLDLVGRRPGGRGMPPQRKRDVEQAEAQLGAVALAEAEAAARERHAVVETMELVGEAGRQVCEAAAHWHADVVVLRAGGRDRPPVGPSHVGPTARYVTEHAPCAVLLVR